MLEYLIAFLEQLGAAVNEQHIPMYTVQGRLALSVRGRVVFIDEDDFEKPVEQLVRECCAIAIGKAAAAQLSEGSAR